jgi:hypothetical protein
MRRVCLLAAFTTAMCLAGRPLDLVAQSSASGQSDAWYSEGDFHPAARILVTLTNDLDVDRVNQPVVIRRDQLPITDIHEMALTVVDPSLPPSPAPSPERLKLFGGHEKRAELHGHAVLQQMDDLDKDGVWDELFFITDIKARSSKAIHLYLGMNQRGWNPHETHAGIGSYCRHLVPFWETKHIGWKLWFPTNVDVYAKRKPMLVAHRLYMENLDGYGVTLLDPAMGSDIQSVDQTLGGGGICLFESPGAPTAISLPRFTPARTAAGVSASFNAGPIGDTRYSFDVVANGPVRSMIRVRTMNWQSGKGSYELEQLYTAYAHQNYSTCQVRFTRFLPALGGVEMGAGIRKKPNENHFYQEDGVVITASPEEVMDPDEGTVSSMIDLIGSALVVRNEYRPEYRFSPDFKGNHTFKVTPRPDGSFEYLIAGAWSEGAILNTYAAFEAYVKQVAREYQSPVRVVVGAHETRPAR